MQQSIICPAGLRALRCQEWLLKATREFASIYPTIERIDAFLVSFGEARASEPIWQIMEAVPGFFQDFYFDSTKNLVPEKF